MMTNEKYKLTIKKLVTSKNGDKYWRATDGGETTYSYQTGDVITKSSNKVTRYVDGKTIHIFQPITKTPRRTPENSSRAIDKKPQQEEIYDDQYTEVAKSLASAINAILEGKNTEITKVSVKNRQFIIKYTKNKKEREAHQPIK